MLAVGPIGAQRIKVTTQTVPLYVTVTDSEKRLVPDLTQRRLRGLRQRQAADAHQLRQRADPDHGRRHARYERQHDARAGPREGRRRTVPDADDAARQGNGWRVQRQDRVPSVVVHRQPRPARARPEGSRLRVSRRGCTTRSIRASISSMAKKDARSCWSSRMATTTRARRALAP